MRIYDIRSNPRIVSCLVVHTDQCIESLQEDLLRCVTKSQLQKYRLHRLHVDQLSLHKNAVLFAQSKPMKCPSMVHWLSGSQQCNISNAPDVFERAEDFILPVMPASNQIMHTRKMHRSLDLSTQNCGQPLVQCVHLAQSATSNQTQNLSTDRWLITSQKCNISSALDVLKKTVDFILRAIHVSNQSIHIRKTCRIPAP